MTTSAITEITVPQEADTPLPSATAFIMALACAVSVANIYYNQPLLNVFAGYFHTTVVRAGFIATAAQVGYGAGMLVFVPLGDLLERRRLVLRLMYACTFLLCLTAAAHTLAMLAAVQLLVGLTAVSPQLLIPLAVEMSPPSMRGRTVGTIMAGLLSGLLLARTFAGIVGDRLGWRAMFWIAAVAMLAMTLVLQNMLPTRPPRLRMSYGKLMASLWGLLRDEPSLRSAAIVSGMSFATFSGFWAVLSFFMHDRFHRGATEAGLFGLVGLAGAMCAPIAGRLSDKRGFAFTVLAAVVVSIAGFAVMGAWVSIAGLVVGVLLLDLGVQATQVAAQSQVMALNPEARNRLNTLYMVGRFAGGAAGSAAGTAIYARSGWSVTCLACVVILAAAAAVYGVAARRPAAYER